MERDSNDVPTGKQSKRWTSYRSAHRMRSHQEAHDAAEDADVPPVLDHPLVPRRQPKLIRTDAELADLVRSLRAAASASEGGAPGGFAYDSEFIGEHTYHPLLCVIQIATAEDIWLIDPLAEVNLAPFWQLIADPSLEKIVHAGVQDLEPVVRHLNQPPANIIDVQIAAAFVGVHYPSSLIRLVTELTGADLGHGAKFSQWDRRPLSPVQIQYAANDVRYLPLLRSVIGEKLDAIGNTQWAAEECAALTDIDLYRFDPQNQRIRVRGIEALGSKRKAVLRALVGWREHKAMQENVPPRALMRDEVLYELARAKVKSTKDLLRIRGLPRPVRQRCGDELVNLIKQSLAEPAPKENHKRRSMRDVDVDRSRVNALWDAISERAVERSIHPAIVTSKKELTRYIYADEIGRSRDEMRISRGWRAKLLDGILDTTGDPQS